MSNNLEALTSFDENSMPPMMTNKEWDQFVRERRESKKPYVLIRRERYDIPPYAGVISTETYIKPDEEKEDRITVQSMRTQDYNVVKEFEVAEIFHSWDCSEDLMTAKYRIAENVILFYFEATGEDLLDEINKSTGEEEDDS